MTTDDKHMDESFKKASGEMKFSYQASFWKEVESQLADDSMDSAFKVAAGTSAFIPPMPDLSANLDDVFLDDAFKSAGADVAVNYKPEFWNQFQENLSAIQQDEAFVSAANTVKADYRPHYWNAADMALQEEGLHYEYKKSYWNEARMLLDRADRRVFFMRWSGAAIALLLLSFAGIYSTLGDNGEQAGSSILANYLRNDVNPATAFNTENLAENEIENNVNPAEAILPGNTADQPGLDLSATNTHESVQHSVNHSNTLPVENRTVLSTGNELAGSNQTPEVVINLPEGGNGFVNPEPSATGGAIVPEISLPVNPLGLVTATTSQLQQPADAGRVEANALENTERSELIALNKFAPQLTVPIIVEQNTTISQPQIEVKRFSLPSTHNISFYGLAGIGNKYGVAEFSPSWRTHFGVEYMNTSFGRLRNFEFGGSIGMSYARQDYIGAEKRVSVFHEDGGVENYWFKLRMKDLIYANATAIVAYRINQDHKLRLGISFDHLAMVQSSMNYRDEEHKDMETVNNNWGVKEGIRIYDLRVGFGYEIQFSNRFAAQLNGSYGFFDRTENNFIRNSIMDHEMNVTVGLKYTLFRKL